MWVIFFFSNFQCSRVRLLNYLATRYVHTFTAVSWKSVQDFDVRRFPFEFWMSRVSTTRRAQCLIRSWQNALDRSSSRNVTFESKIAYRVSGFWVTLSERLSAYAVRQHETFAFHGARDRLSLECACGFPEKLRKQ